MSELWPSQKVSTTRCTKSVAKAQPIRMEWTTGFLSMAFVLILVAAVGFGLYHFVFEPMFAQMQSVVNVLPTTLRK